MTSVKATVVGTDAVVKVVALVDKLVVTAEVVRSRSSPAVSYAAADVPSATSTLYVPAESGLMFNFNDTEVTESPVVNVYEDAAVQSFTPVVAVPAEL